MDWNLIIRLLAIAVFANIGTIKVIEWIDSCITKTLLQLIEPILYYSIALVNIIIIYQLYAKV